jgi:dTDP-4-dehydrorhamnose reductase
VLQQLIVASASQCYNSVAPRGLSSSAAPLPAFRIPFSIVSSMPDPEASLAKPSPAPCRVLIFGGTGMLGHKLWQAAHARFDTWVTVRGEALPAGHPLLPAPERVITAVDVAKPLTWTQAIERTRPHVIINAAGLIKQRAEAGDAVAAIQVNALFPHQLARHAASIDARLIQLGTDCVFSGRTGGYRESDVPDPTDLYGRSKLLGEVTGRGALTLRTSMIGRELSSKLGLVEWFLGRRGEEADGFTHAIFSGLTTPVLAALIVDLIEHHPHLTGLYHVAAAPIDKHRLLALLNHAFDAKVRITASDRLRIDRSLDGARFRDATGFVAPSWEAMIAQLAQEPVSYDQWRLPA